MTKSKTDRCCGQSTNGASRVVIEVKDAPSTFRVSTAQGRTKGSRFQYPSWQLLLNQMSEFKVRKIGETERLQRSANDGRLSQQGSSNSNPNEPRMPQWNRRRTLVGAQKQRLHPTPLSHARKFESQKIPLGSFSLVPLRDWWRRHSRPCNKWANTQINPILPVNALSI